MSDNAIVRAIEYLYQHRQNLKADLRGGGRGRPSRQISEVNRYQEALESEYEDWADETAEAIDEAADAEDQKKIIDERLAILLLLLIALGRKRIPQALALGLGGEAPTPDSFRRLADRLAENERYLAESLIPAIREKLGRALSDTDIQLALATGVGAEVIRAILQTIAARVSSYAGQWWDIFNVGRGLQALLVGKRLRWNIDPQAQHCVDCLEYGEKEYDSFESLLLTTGGKYPSHGVACLTNCRCELEAI